ncbi:MAG: NAD(P)-binding protein, partial [Planctomycetes bacterium]|nr:NAD(P)-binding protein [Planctomycetota bacterium]
MKKKIAILGGGIGAITAAFELTRDPDWRDHYEVTVYQMGWRLGGKCASGRNAAYGERIEEHGLHIWLGFYHNSFRIIQDCYKELARPAGTPLATWEEAFKKHSLVTLMEQREGRWQRWVLDFPPNEGVPGKDGLFLKNPWDYVQILLAWVKEWHNPSGTSPPGEALTSAPHQQLVVSWKEVIHQEIVRGTRILHESVVLVETLLMEQVETGLAWVEPHLHHAYRLARHRHEDPRHEPAVHHSILWMLEKFFHGYLQNLKQQIDQDDDLRHKWILLRLGVVIVMGMLKDGVCQHGF